MLSRLYISNVVIIDRLELDFRAGLSVLTGETGAGKSILLDALALALGAKSDTSLIRAGTESATVAAEFSKDGGETIMLKRVLSADGKSKCYIDDEPVALKSLTEAGLDLVEIHGQFANRGLLDEKTHIHSLDAFARLHSAGAARQDYGELLENVGKTYAEMRGAEKKSKELTALAEKSAEERGFLEHNIKELETLKPKAGEEEALAETRRRMMDMEKNAGILKDAIQILEQGGGAEKIFSAAHILERTKSYQAEIDRLYEIGSALQEIKDGIAPKDALDVADLEAAEERLFALRAAARKHRAPVDELPSLLEKMRADLNSINDSADALKKSEADLKIKKSNYEKAAAELTRERIAAGVKLREKMLKELPDLKLGAADFMVDIKEGAPGACGSDAVSFIIKTNPGTPFAPLDKIASGGELARFMLALRVVLAGNSSRTLIFDEIDSEISGATAAAVGNRLAELAKRQQIIAITHSAQVAGFADAHFLILKHTDGKTTTTSVSKIEGAAREAEIARIISGAKITPDSVAAAKRLMKS